MFLIVHLSVIVSHNNYAVVILYVILILPVLVFQKKFVDVIQHTVVNIKQGHQDVHNAIHIKNVHVIHQNVVAMDTMQGVASAIVIVHVHVIVANAPVMGMTLDVHSVIHIVPARAIHLNAVAMDIMQVVDSVIVTTVVVVILNVIMIVQQIMVNVL